MLIRCLIIAALLGIAHGSAYAEAPACPQVLGKIAPPVVSHPTGKTHLLCYRAYAVLFSEQTRTAIWSAERLSAANLLAARSVPRDSDFFEEPQLPASKRARLSDYGHGTGYDRGHLAPSGDFADAAAQADSFSLANVVPQRRESNRLLWSHIETATRRLVRSQGEAWVVTGPIFEADHPTLLNGRIAIPQYLWKAIYLPGTGAAAYIARNDATLKYTVVSVARLAELTGVEAFPNLTKRQRQSPIALPGPVPHPGEKTGRLVSEAELMASAIDTPGATSLNQLQDRLRAALLRAIASN
ncbi:MAG TPA: DNA/RNA non-specific endonuclease [Dongiaceae bacterium]|nr:DNA/RNA non-specific endonuclease [Dongiaceae bacterium]